MIILIKQCLKIYSCRSNSSWISSIEVAQFLYILHQLIAFWHLYLQFIREFKDELTCIYKSETRNAPFVFFVTTSKLFLTNSCIVADAFPSHWRLFHTACHEDDSSADSIKRFSFEVLGLFGYFVVNALGFMLYSFLYLQLSTELINLLNTLSDSPVPIILQLLTNSLSIITISRKCHTQSSILFREIVFLRSPNILNFAGWSFSRIFVPFSVWILKMGFGNEPTLLAFYAAWFMIMNLGIRRFAMFAFGLKVSLPYFHLCLNLILILKNVKS